MSDEWKVGDRAYVPVEIVGYDSPSETAIFVRVSKSACVHALKCDLIRSIPPSPPAPVDVSAIRVGDEVTVRGVVIQTDRSDAPFNVRFCNDYAWIEGSEFASHTPTPRPTTLAKFDAMTPAQRERWFAEMTKGKVTA